MFWHCSNAFGNIFRHTVAARADFIEEWTIVTTYSVEYLYIPGGSAVKWIANILFTFVYDQMLAKWMTFPTVLVVFYCCLVLLIHCLDSSWHNRRHDFLSPGIHWNDFWTSDFVYSHNSTSDRWFTDCGNLVYILFVVVLQIRSELICSAGSQCARYSWWGHLYIFVIWQQLHSNNVITEHDNPQLPKRSPKTSVPWLSVCVSDALCSLHYHVFPVFWSDRPQIF